MSFIDDQTFFIITDHIPNHKINDLGPSTYYQSKALPEEHEKFNFSTPKYINLADAAVNMM